MISALDSSIIFDVLLNDPTFGTASLTVVRAARRVGSLIACEVVWAEVAARFESAEDASRAMAHLGVAFQAMRPEQAIDAGVRWREYRRRGGPRTRITSDFLIGAHALTSADRLLTRDRGFYRRYFSELDLVAPGTRGGGTELA